MNGWRLSGLSLAFGVLLLLVGCTGTDVLIREVGASGRADYGTLGDGSRLGAAAANLLANRMLQEEFERAPDEVLRRLEQTYRCEKNPELLAALADLAQSIGRKTEDPDRAASARLSTLLYCYEYLTEVDRPREEPYCPQRLLIMRHYNLALTELFAYLSERDLALHSSFQLTSLTGCQVRFLEPELELPLPSEDVEALLLCADYRPCNLTHVSYRFGLGVPLICKLRDGVRMRGQKIFSGQSLPATLIIRFERDPSSPGRFTARLAGYGTLDREEVALNGQTEHVPLELDFSTPIAYMTRKPPLFGYLAYMLNPSATKEMQGLYLMQPYDPDRIPVVFVHGLMSNARTWVQMVNTLQNDPVIRRHYQFWGFSYSSGNPVLFSAYMLRRELDLAVERNTRPGEPSHLQDMVVVGHSMGGLLTRALVTTSDQENLERVFGVKLEELETELGEEERRKLDEILLFSARPYISRVVFIAVPHRGAELATSWIGRFGAALIELPHQLIQTSRAVLEAAARRRDATAEQQLRVATGIDNLDPGDDTLTLLNALPWKSGMPYHSIIGNREKERTPGGSDGIVPYSSSHLDGAASELVVKSGHSVQQQPSAILELRRILLEHLRSLGRDTSSCQETPAASEVSRP